MGLDVYLYKYKNFEDTEERENKYQEYDNQLWSEVNEYDKLTEEEKNEIRSKAKEYAITLNLDEFGGDTDNKTIYEEDHPDYPEHLFKIGYFRSSYNEGGIERILNNYGLPTLHDIFEPNDAYKFKPNWEESLVKIESLIKEFDTAGEYRVKPLYTHSYRDNIPKTSEEALKLFLEENSKKENSEYNYSNSVGEFNLAQPEEVLAFIPGKCRYIFNDRECIFVITKSDNKWYKEALIIVRDTIKFVLSQEDKEQYYLHWSG